MLFLTVRRVGGPPWLGLLPMAVVAPERRPDVPRAQPAHRIATTYSSRAQRFTRPSGRSTRASLPTPPAGQPRSECWSASARRFVSWACRWWRCSWSGCLLASQGSWRRRGSIAAAAGVGAALILAWFVIAQHEKTGYTGLTPRAGSWNLYARVAPFADCTKFTPPKGTQMLVRDDARVRSGRWSQQYDYDPDLSPAVKAFGYPFLFDGRPEPPRGRVRAHGDPAPAARLPGGRGEGNGGLHTAASTAREEPPARLQL